MMREPMLHSDMLMELGNLYTVAMQKPLPESFTAGVMAMISCAKLNEEALKKWHRFVEEMKKEKKVRIVSFDVPEGILPYDCSGILEDIKVDGKGPDDIIYNKHPEIRKQIARGNTTLQLKGNDSWYDVVIYGNKKFTGGVGDEDEAQPDNNELWRDYCLKNPDSASQVICTSKFNGEAAHFSGRYIEGRFYLFVGSKNVHMLIENKDDIDKYEGTRFEIAKIIGHTVCDTLEKMKDDHRHVLYSFLHHTKCTMVCEILQPNSQHIVNLSYLCNPELRLISCTSTPWYDAESSLLALPPHHALDVFSTLGLKTVSYHIIGSEDVLAHREKIRKDIHKEGEVFYFLDESEKTIGIVKIKTTWYIILRALREKAVYAFTSKKDGRSLQDKIGSTHKRFREIQKWLKFSNSFLGSWNKLGESFLYWLKESITKNKVVATDIRPKFPIIWEMFLKESNQIDTIPL